VLDTMPADAVGVNDGESTLRLFLVLKQFMKSVIILAKHVYKGAQPQCYVFCQALVSGNVPVSQPSKVR
jgi:hypothetical protein